MITSVCWIKKDEVQGCALSSLQCFIKAVKTVPIILRRFSSGIGKERTEGWDPRGPFSDFQDTSRTKISGLGLEKASRSIAPNVIDNDYQAQGSGADSGSWQSACR